MRDPGRYYEIPAGFHPPIEQAAVVLAASRQKEAARRFVEYLRRPAVARVLQSYGFEVP
jgi:molybdate transport system substrate-binding protein